MIEIEYLKHIRFGKYHDSTDGPMYRSFEGNGSTFVTYLEESGKFELTSTNGSGIYEDFSEIVILLGKTDMEYKLFKRSRTIKKILK